jgi:hypothetical protein
VDLEPEFLNTLANAFDFLFARVLPHRNHHRRTLLKQKGPLGKSGPVSKFCDILRNQRRSTGSGKTRTGR